MEKKYEQINPAELTENLRTLLQTGDTENAQKGQCNTLTSMTMALSSIALGDAKGIEKNKATKATKAYVHDSLADGENV